MNFVTDLPESEGHTNIMMIVDKLMKGVILKGLKELMTECVTKMIIQSLIKRHGFSHVIMSDKGAQFTGELWSCVC